VLWHCWLGHISLTRKIVSEMTYIVSSGTLNPTIPYHSSNYLPSLVEIPSGISSVKCEQTYLQTECMEHPSPRPTTVGVGPRLTTVGVRPRLTTVGVGNWYFYFRQGGAYMISVICQSFCLSVCVYVCRITAKVIRRFHWNLMSWLVYQSEELINCWWRSSLVDSRSLFHFPHHCRIWDFGRFISIFYSHWLISIFLWHSAKWWCRQGNETTTFWEWSGRHPDPNTD